MQRELAAALKKARGHEPEASMTDDSWPEPEPLRNALLPVKPFDLEFLPASIAPWVYDIAARMQCPLDFPGVSTLVALGAVSVGVSVSARSAGRIGWRFLTSGAAL